MIAPLALTNKQQGQRWKTGDQEKVHKIVNPEKVVEEDVDKGVPSVRTGPLSTLRHREAGVDAEEGHIQT